MGNFWQIIMGIGIIMTGTTSLIMSPQLTLGIVLIGIAQICALLLIADRIGTKK